jgi:hypothetical protein
LSLVKKGAEIAFSNDSITNLISNLDRNISNREEVQSFENIFISYFIKVIKRCKSLVAPSSLRGLVADIPQVFTTSIIV